MGLFDTIKGIFDREARIRALEAELRAVREEVLRDHLTGLYSRKFLLDRVNAMQSEAKRNKADDVFVLFIDADRFKAVNDTHGHAAGDAVLKGIAAVVLDNIRANDIAARWGGEEMVVLGRGDGKVVAERIRAAVAAKPIDGIVVTVSIGLCVFDRNETIEYTIQRADRAMYKAKQSGRNRVVVDGNN